jgi:hypothetical protein
MRRRRNRRWAAAVYALQLRNCGYSPRDAVEIVATQFRTTCLEARACARIAACPDMADMTGHRKEERNGNGGGKNAGDTEV